jgi:hypothetical protein
MSIPDQRELTQAPRGDVTARFILAEARALGIRIGAAPDGSDWVMLVPRSVPRETRVWFARKLKEFRAEVIDLILRENAGGQS